MDDDDFDGEILSFDDDLHGFFNRDNYADQLEAETREANYLAELDEIESMRKWLRNQHATKQMSYARMREGLDRLNAKMESIKRRHQGNTIPRRKPRSGNPNGRPRETPRKIAGLRGDTYYLSGKACPAGHMSKRRVSSGCCIQCGKDWTANNRDKARVHWRESKQLARDRE